MQKETIYMTVDYLEKLLSNNEDEALKKLILLWKIESNRLEKLGKQVACGWQKGKPDCACVFLTRHKYKERYEYNIWMFEWQIGEPPEDSKADDDTVYWYLAWENNEGEEWGDIADCNFDEYLIIEILPTMAETHEKWKKSFSHASA